MLRYENIEFLNLLYGLIGLVFLFIYFKKWKKNALMSFGDIKLTQKLIPSFSKSRENIRFIILIFCLSSLIIGISNPQIGTKMAEVKREGVDLMIALDLSNSMLAEDIEPNRLERAKQAISRLIDKLNGDRIGLIVFAGDAYVQLPITTDYSAGKLFLSTVNTNMIPTQGTAIGKAIDLSMQSFDMENEQNKAIIIITDGENHEDDAIEQAQKASEKGVFVHTLGMGLVKGGPIPIYNKYGNNMGYRKNKEGNTIISQLNEQMLQEIAASGNGIYVRANNTKAGLSVLFSEINKMEKKEIGSMIFTDYKDRFQLFLVISLFLLILDLILLDRKNEWMKKIFVFILLIPLFGNAQNKKTNLRNGNDFYGDSLYNEAELEYTKSLEKDQDYFEASFNLADAVYKQGRYEESSSLFDALKDNTKTDTELAKIYHNLGNSLIKEQQVEDAIKAYKEALRKNPKDEDTRYNLAYAQRIKEKQQKQQQDKDKEKKEEKQQEEKSEEKQQEEKSEEKQQEEDKEQQQKPQEKEDMSKEDAEKILEALQQQEKELQEKLQKKKIKGRKMNILKDW